MACAWARRIQPRHFFPRMATWDSHSSVKAWRSMQGTVVEIWEYIHPIASCKHSSHDPSRLQRTQSIAGAVCKAEVKKESRRTWIISQGSKIPNVLSTSSSDHCQGSWSDLEAWQTRRPSCMMAERKQFHEWKSSKCQEPAFQRRILYTILCSSFPRWCKLNLRLRNTFREYSRNVAFAAPVLDLTSGRILPLTCNWPPKCLYCATTATLQSGKNSDTMGMDGVSTRTDHTNQRA